MTRVLVGQSYFLRFDPKLWSAHQPYPPLGALYAAACLRMNECNVALFDAMLAESEAEWDHAIVRHLPEIAVIYEDNFNYLTKMCLGRMRQAALTMLAMAKARGCTTVVSGSDATDHASVYLDNGADFVILGEGEATLMDLVGHLAVSPGLAPAQIDGLCFRTPDGDTMRTRPRAIERNLDALPLPAWDLVDLDRYQTIWRRHHGFFSVNVATTRGCPYHCNWCAKPIYGQRYNVRSPERVVEEMGWLKATCGADHFTFVDDIFGLKPGWVQRFAEIVIAHGLATPFKCLSRADLLSDVTVNALRAAGCRTVWIGAESGSQRVLDAMEKGIRVDQIHDATRRLRAAGIEVGFFLQFGYPGETRDDIERTRAMVEACEPDDIGISVSYPLPGTSFYDRVKVELGTKQNWNDSEDLAMMFQGTYTTEFYRQLHRVLHQEFRQRKAAHALRAGLRRPRSLRLAHARHSAMLAYRSLTLPFERRRLDRLAAVPHPSIGLLTPSLTVDAASRPSAQSPSGQVERG